MCNKMLCILTIAILSQYVSIATSELPPSCESKIYCQGQLLHTVQMAKIFDDSKTFVDMSTCCTPDKVLENFSNLMNSSNNHPIKEDIEEFVKQNFLEGKELEEWTPSDYNPNPGFLEKIEDEIVKEFAYDVVKIWPSLGRKVVEDVKEKPDQHSLIYVPNGFIIPGGRFREFYYWDSYWILRGLLISEMYETAKGMLGNFLYIVEKYGFIPNGGRVYYLNRSQPPLLTKMAKDYYDATKDEDWVLANIETLTKEVEWWLQNKVTTVSVNGKDYKLATYNSESLGPRPESYRQDIETSNEFPDDQSQQQLFNELKGAAQSGWDFSARWIFDQNGNSDAHISSTKTSKVIPVDLNAFLYGAFSDLAELFGILNKPTDQQIWSDHAETLKEAINNVLWDEEDGIWYDYNTELETKRKMFAASNLTPLWTRAYDTSNGELFGSKAVDYLKREEIHDFLGGIPTTKIHSGEQWDFPNAWPPLQSIVAHGLRDTGESQAIELAKQFAENWVLANMIGFEETGSLFEKYDAVVPGQYGGGGEYKVQTGFGWTNGVVLDFINTYPNIKHSNLEER